MIHLIFIKNRYTVHVIYSEERVHTTALNKKYVLSTAIRWHQHSHFL